MPPAHPPLLRILPGQLLVTFLVCMGRVGGVLVVPPGQFLEGLRAAAHLTGFAELLREDEGERLDELLPWAGNV